MNFATFFCKFLRAVLEEDLRAMLLNILNFSYDFELLYAITVRETSTKDEKSTKILFLETATRGVQ